MNDHRAARVEVHRDPATLATAVASELLSRLASVQAEGRDPHLALTGGSMARAIHTEVARLSPDSAVDWTRVEVWWSDERFVDPGSEERNEGQARADFLDAVGASRVHPMPSTAEAATAEAGAAAYAELVGAAVPDGFDLALLSIGPDGHIASLFPGHPGLEVTDRLAFDVVDSPKPPPERITLALPTLNRTAAVWFLGSGEAKAEVVEAALALEGDVRDIPARGVEGSTETIWFLDKAAASLL